MLIMIPRLKRVHRMIIDVFDQRLTIPADVTIVSAVIGAGFPALGADTSGAAIGIQRSLGCQRISAF